MFPRIDIRHKRYTYRLKIKSMFPVFVYSATFGVACIFAYASTGIGR